MNLNELISEATMAGWQIKIERIAVCIACLVEGDEQGTEYGAVLNHEDKLVYISNVDVVDTDDCDFAMDHFDYKVEQALKNLLEKGQIKMVVEDGQIKYMVNPSDV